MKTKSKTIRLIAVLLVFAELTVLPAGAGDLEPPGAPAPTMKTLDEVEPRVPIHTSDLPLTISEPNSYYLVEDVNFTSTTNHAITIECNDVTIDLMGYTLKGPDLGTKSGFYMNNRSNVEIRNGTIRDFGYPAIREVSSSSTSHRVVNIRAISNGYGLYIYGNGHLIKGCVVAQNNSGHGIYVPGSANTITDNTVYDNNSSGIFTSIDCIVTDNTANKNNEHGIVTSTGCTVTGNTTNDNDLYGISAGGGSTIAGNTARNNQGYGIHTGNGSTVTSNTAYSNQLNGINVGDGCTVTGNTAFYNLNNGIYAGSGCTVTGNTVLENNTSDSAGYAGIRIGYGCLVKGNTARDNNQNNIYVSGSGNAIKENVATNCTLGNGINLSGADNLYANNYAEGNSTDYASTGDDTDGGGNF